VAAGCAAMLLFNAGRALGGPFADFVQSFTPGMAAGFGADKLPGIVLGPPQGGGELSGSLDVVSLGNNGVIVLGFDLPVICDGPGADLTVFENPFHSGSIDGPIFAEYGIVAVSQDGVNFVTFPYDPVTHAGLAGQTPVLSNPDNGISPLDPNVSGGDQFDLADVGLSWAKYVRITDPGASIDDPGNHLMPPGTSAGFDLDALAALHACDPGLFASPTPTATLSPEVATATATPTVTPGESPAAHDVSVAAHRPIHVRIGKGASSASKHARIIVHNADPDGSIPIRLTATGCNSLATVTVDFDQRTAGAQDTATVRSGRRRAAIVTVSVAGASITTPDRHQPIQCELTFSAAADVPGNVDPTPADNMANIELIVLDTNDFD